MADTEIAVGILVSASTLYGFTIAYYVFGRSLQAQEQGRHWDSYRNRHDLGVTDDLEEKAWETLQLNLRRVWVRRVELNGFLLVATAVFALAFVSEMLYLVPQIATLSVQAGADVFVVLALCVTAFFLYVGADNLRSTLAEWDPEDDARALQMRAEGRSVWEIANWLDYPLDDVTARLRALDSRHAARPVGNEKEPTLGH